MIATDNPTIRAKLVGVDTAIAAGITVIAYAPTLELCRKLIAAGYHPAARLEAYRGETLALIIGSIGAAADLTVEDDKQGKDLPSLEKQAARGWRSPAHQFFRGGGIRHRQNRRAGRDRRCCMSDIRGAVSDALYFQTADYGDTYAEVDLIFAKVAEALQRDGRLRLSSLEFDLLFADAKRAAEVALAEYSQPDWDDAVEAVMRALSRTTKRKGQSR